MGCANLYIGHWTGHRRWDLEARLVAAGHRWPSAKKAIREQCPMSGVECVGRILACLDGRDDPTGSVADLSPEAIEMMAGFRGKSGVLFDALCGAGYIDNPGTSDAKWHDYSAYNAKRVAGRIKKRGQRNSGLRSGSVPPASRGDTVPTKQTPTNGGTESRPQSPDVLSPESSIAAAARARARGEAQDPGSDDLGDFGVPRPLLELAVHVTGWAGNERTMAAALSEVRTSGVDDVAIRERLLALGDHASGVTAFALKRLLLRKPGAGQPGDPAYDAPALVPCARCQDDGPPDGYDHRQPATHGPGTRNDDVEGLEKALCLPHAEAWSDARRKPRDRSWMPEKAHDGATA